MKIIPWQIKHPFAWSLLCSGLSLFLIEVGVFLFQRGLSRAAALTILAGLLFILVEIVLFLPTLFRNAIRQTNIAFLFKITTAGFVYILMIFLISAAAINTGNNLLYIILAFMISSISISGVVSRMSLVDLHLSVDYQDAIFAGEYTTYRLRVANRKRWFPSFSIGVEGFLVDQTWLLQNGHPEPSRQRWDERRIRDCGVPAMRTVAYFPFIPGRGEESQVFQVRFERRGLYRITGIEVTTAFPFGFFRKGRRIATSGDLIVFPALVEKENLHSFLETHAELVPLLRRGLGSDLFMLRDYVPGEDVRHMHWKATARSGRYIVKDFSPESTACFLFLIDETAPGDPAASAERYDRAVSFLATLALELRERGKRVAFAMSHETANPAETRQDLPAILENLSISYLRPLPDDPTRHPFNRTPTAELIPPEWMGYVVLCSFQAPTFFFELSPYLNNYLDLNQL